VAAVQPQVNLPYLGQARALNAPLSSFAPTVMASTHPGLAAAAGAAGAAAAQHLAQYAPVPAADAVAGFGLGGTANGYGGYGGAGGSAQGFGSQPAPQATGGADAPASSSGLTGLASFTPQPDHTGVPAGSTVVHAPASTNGTDPVTGQPYVGQFQPTGRSALGAPVFAQGGGGAAASSLNDYERQYLESINQSRATIDSQYKAALADVGAREANAQKALGLLPGQVNAVYANGGANLGSAEHALDAGEAAAGIHGYTSAADQMAPLQFARSGDQAARIADVPLLNIGAASQFSRERANLAQDQLSAIDQANQEQRQYLLGRMSGQDAQQQALQQHQWNEQDAASAHAQSLADARPTFGTQETGTARGEDLATYDPAQASQLRGTTSYNTIANAARGATSYQDAVARIQAAGQKLMGSIGNTPGMSNFITQLGSLALFDLGRAPTTK